MSKLLKKKRHINPLETEAIFRFLVTCLEDYGVVMMNTQGRVVTWNEGARKIFGFTEQEAIGRPVSFIFSHADKKINIPALEIATAKLRGRADDERQHRRKDGSLFWATGVMWAIKDDEGNLLGFSKLIRDVSEQKAMADTIRHQSLHDLLTGLPNRRGFEERLTLALNNAKINHTELAIIFFDLDNFKKINDVLGHDTGDILLQEVASRISFTLRKGDIICRIGGDEFIILIDNIRQSKSITTVLKKLQAVLYEPFDISNKKIQVTASLGVARYPLDGKSSRRLEKRADIALYKAKDAGKNQYKYYQEKKKVTQRSLGK